MERSFGSLDKQPGGVQGELRRERHSMTDCYECHGNNMSIGEMRLLSGIQP